MLTAAAVGVMPECPLLRTLWLESDLFREHCVKLFGRHGTFATAAQTRMHVHHIFGGKTRKDLPSNTITICGAVHDFCHTHQTEGRIACLWAKMESEELDWTEIDEAAGFRVSGWLTSLPIGLLEMVFCRMRAELASAAALNRSVTDNSTARKPPMPHT